MRKYIAVIAGILMLAAVNFTIYQREHLLEQGSVVLLELAPVDPRSLMQGDYMALRFKVARDAFPGFGWNDVKEGTPSDGHLVVTLDEHGVGSFKHFADATPLAKNEALLRYRIRNQQPKFATNAFFFQEGHAEEYAKARYGEFRVAQNGDMILTALRGADYQKLGLAQ
ncbi:MAG: GDYXXLXY domain-containing protein [Proteobacteria bacterium]|nr:GDYXXLXY domain-containing protein [Pseudomonadota bacterium]